MENTNTQMTDDLQEQTGNSQQPQTLGEILGDLGSGYIAEGDRDEIISRLSRTSQVETQTEADAS